MALAEQLAGIFIAIEGIDGSGKSTIAERLAVAARDADLDVVLTREPGGTAIGEQIRAVLLGARSLDMRPETETLLFSAARAQHVAELIVPALRRGAVVITDRYTDSTLAYQWGGRGLSRDMVDAAQDLATRGVQPHLKLFLDVPVDVAMRRRGSDVGSSNRIDRESIDFHTRVREAYLALAIADPERWHVLDAALPMDDVFRNAVQILDQSALLSRSLSSGTTHVELRRPL